jgi:hypothetical protein
MRFRFRCNTSSNTVCLLPGRRFWTISGSIGRRTKIISTFVLFATAFAGTGLRGCGDARWRRVTEVRARSAKSVFHFNVQGSVAHSTHAGLPWLLYLRKGLGQRVHFWPFDGWEVPANTSAIAEVYPALWNKSFPAEGRTRDQQDAFAVTQWLRLADADGALQRCLNPQLEPLDLATAEIEGWILGVES